MKIIIILISFSFIISAACATRQVDSNKVMVKHQIIIGTEVYEFDIPSGESRDYPFQKVRSVFEFPIDNSVFPKKGVSMVEKFWDYKNARVGVSNDGTFRFSIRVRKFDGEYKYSVDHKHEIKRYLIDEISGAFLFLNKKYLSEGNDQMVVDMPQDIIETRIDGRLAFSYSVGGGKDSDVFVLPISDSYFIQIQFDFIDNSFGRGVEWRVKAQSDADAILKTIRISRNSKK